MNRQIAILVADGVEAGPITALTDRLVVEGAVPRFMGSWLGAVDCASGGPIRVDATLAATSARLYDGVVVPDGEEAVKRLAADRRALAFLKDLYREHKPMLIIGAAAALLDTVGISATLPGGATDPGVLVYQGAHQLDGHFLAVIGKYRDRMT